jgi:PP-loop superfamily ATP-utilizing enzyme
VLRLTVVGFVVLLLAGADCSGTQQCNQCFPCTSAIDLVVLDEQNNALTDNWTVEATLDGQEVQDVTNCDPATRGGGNECSFGSTAGVYRITVRDVDRQPRELAARFAAKIGQSCCQCLQQTKVTAVMLPAVVDGGT